MSSSAHVLHDGGSIRLVVGPMFSGKTTELVRAIKVAQHAKMRCFLVRPSADTRSDDLRTHCGLEIHEDAAERLSGPDFLVLTHTILANTADIMGKVLVAVDEGQFFTNLTAGATMLANSGAHVVIAALDGSFSQEPFPEISQLYPHCEWIEKKTAVCGACQSREAPFTVLLEGVVISDEAKESQREVGGTDKYRAVCRWCLKSGD